MPVALTIVLSKRNPKLFRQAFERVVDNGRTLRTFLQMVRSGRFGRKSLSYALQRAVQRWLNGASVEKLLNASIGNDPSLRDVLRLARPTPIDDARRALFGWLTDKPVEKWAPATEALSQPIDVQPRRRSRSPCCRRSALVGICSRMRRCRPMSGRRSRVRWVRKLCA
jgi:60 kDa SS-A/Ro ribonucleoprotein